MKHRTIGGLCIIVTLIGYKRHTYQIKRIGLNTNHLYNETTYEKIGLYNTDKPFVCIDGIFIMHCIRTEYGYSRGVIIQNIGNHQSSRKKNEAQCVIIKNSC